MEAANDKIQDQNFESFILLVKELRFNQRRYKLTLKPETLKVCIDLEAKIDAIISKHYEGQIKLF